MSTFKRLMTNKELINATKRTNNANEENTEVSCSLTAGTPINKRQKGDELANAFERALTQSDDLTIV